MLHSSNDIVHDDDIVFWEVDTTKYYVYTPYRELISLVVNADKTFKYTSQRSIFLFAWLYFKEWIVQPFLHFQTVVWDNYSDILFTVEYVTTIWPNICNSKKKKTSFLHPKTDIINYICKKSPRVNRKLKQRPS